MSERYLGGDCNRTNQSEYGSNNGVIAITPYNKIV